MRASWACRCSCACSASAPPGEPVHAQRAAARALRGAATNPLPWAILIGAAFAMPDRALPGPVAQVVQMLGDSATPVNAVHHRHRAVARRAPRHKRTSPDRYLSVALVKLVLHPALVYGLDRAAIAFGAPLPAFGLVALTLVAALPGASNVSALAEIYGADSGRVTRIIVASTALAFATFSVLAWAFGAGAKAP